MRVAGFTSDHVAAPSSSMKFAHHNGGYVVANVFYREHSLSYFQPQVLRHVVDSETFTSFTIINISTVKTGPLLVVQLCQMFSLFRCILSSMLPRQNVEGPIWTGFA